MKNFKNLSLKFCGSLIITFLLFGCSSPKAKKSNPVSGTEEAIKKIDYYAENKNTGDWLEIVKKELAAKRKPVLFFTATWCGPCKEFKNSLTDPLMTAALEGITLIMIDIDIDNTKENIGKKYNVRSYPTYVRVDNAGNIIKKTSGGAWDANIPENMAPVLKEFMKD